MREILLTAIQNTTIGGEKLKNSSRGFRIYFIVIALMIIGMYAFSTFSTKDSDYKYNDFITDLKAGNVSEVTIRQNNEVPSGSIVVVLSKDKSRKVVYVTDVNKEFCLTYGEVAEAYEAWRKKKDDLGEELADVAIYLLGLSEILGINLENEIQKKVYKNSKREYKIINGVNTRTKEFDEKS